ncbi:MAG TPA: twin-arginine translocase subunit TatC, partial [Bryobacteraceae bacterium]
MQDENSGAQTPEVRAGSDETDSNSRAGSSAETVTAPAAATVAEEPPSAPPAVVPAGDGSGGGVNSGGRGGGGGDDGDDDDEGMLRMSFLEHLEELRSRIMKALLGVGVAFVLSLIFANEMWEIVVAPARYALT